MNGAYHNPVVGYARKDLAEHLEVSSSISKA